MVQSTLYTLLSAALTAVATARKCQNLTVPISISARNTNFSLQAPATNVEVSDFILNFSQPGMNFTEQALGPNAASNSTSSEVSAKIILLSHTHTPTPFTPESNIQQIYRQPIRNVH